MTTRIVTAIGTLAVIAATASVASANPLLSGYGGPGQGSQVVLGGTLLGGGGGPGESSSPTPLAGTGTVSSPAATSKGTGGPSSGGSGNRRRAPGKGATGKAGTSKGTGVAPHPPASLPAGYPGASGSQPPLGITGQDVLYGLLVLALLGATAVATRELARGYDGHVR